MNTKKNSNMMLIAFFAICITSHLLGGCDENEKTIPTVQDNKFAEMIVGSWKHSTDDGYVMLTLGSDRSVVVSEKKSGNKEEKRGTYSFNSDKMELTTSVSGWGSFIVNSVTENSLTLNGDTYYRVDPSSQEDEEGNNNLVAKSFKGNGTKDSPYLISNAAELRKLTNDVEDGNSYSGKYFKMTADITINKNVLTEDGELNGDGSNFEIWKPIGYHVEYLPAHPFSGTFDGNGYSIRGIYIYDEKGSLNELGLFGFIQDASILNLTLADSYIDGKQENQEWYKLDSYSSGIIGNACGKVLIQNCHNYATVVSIKCSAAGILCKVSYWNAETSNITILKCTNHGIITGMPAAGIAIDGENCIINMCVNYGNLMGASADGISAGGKVLNCINFGKLSAEGVIGIADNYSDWSPVIYNSCNAGDLQGESCYGIVCSFYQYEDFPAPRMINCLNTGTYKGSTKMSGILWSYNNGSIVKNNYCLAIPGVEMELFGGLDNNKGTGGIIENNRFVSEEEAKSQAFLDELNANAVELERETGKSMCRWKRGKNGYPILDYIEE